MKKRTLLHKMIVGSILFIFLGACIPSVPSEETHNSVEEALSYDFEPNRISISLSIGTPHITPIVIDENDYLEISIDDAVSGVGQSGAPSLPVTSGFIPIPQGKTVSSISLEKFETKTIQLDSTVKPIQRPVSTLTLQSSQEIERDEGVYNADEFFPTADISFSMQTFRGISFCCYSFFPVVYNPVQGVLVYSPDVRLVITLEDIADSCVEKGTFRGLQNDVVEAMNLFHNGEEYTDIFETYLRDPSENQAVTRSYDLLILTLDRFRQGFVPLALAHNERGTRTVIRTMRDMYAALGTNDPMFSTSRVDPQLIRDYINHEYTNYGISYVLIGADHEFIPARYLTPSAGVMIPSDFYYACLDGDFDGNGNGIYGEPGDNVDLIAEVYVGRATVSTLDEVHNFVSKTISHMNTPAGADHLKRALFVGELLDNVPTWGGDYMDELINRSDNNDYTTIGIPNDPYSLFEIDTLYDRDWQLYGWPEPILNYPESGWPREHIINRINDGLQIINHFAHANQDFNMKLFSSDVLDLTNTEYCFIYSAGCLAGCFDIDYDDCIAEYFTVKTPHAAFAGIWNARAGWYQAGGTDGPSQRFHRWFWDGVFNEGITVISEANQYSKTINIPHIINDHFYRYICYGLNLFGDPAVSFILPKPEHDVAISSVDIPDHIQSMNRRKVTVTLSNNGLNDEENIMVRLRVNGQEITHTVLPFLAQGTEQSVVLRWNTPSPGKYLVTINVSVPGIVEHDYRNNEKTKNVRVGVLNRETDLLYDTIQAAIDDEATTTGNWILVPRGTYYENLVLYKGVFLKGESREGTILEATRSDIPVISISDVCSASLIGLSIRKGRVGVSVESSTHTLIRDTTITNSLESGISISSSQHTWINTNDIVDNHKGIIIDEYSSLNMICRNNFDNLQNAMDVGFSNQWNGTDPGEGNFWSDFEINPGYPDTYIIPGGISQDMHPLPEPFTSDLSKSIVNWHTGERFFTIGNALSDAETKDGHIVFVGSGTYNEQLTISKRLTLIGENKDTTTIIFHSSNAHVIRITASQVILRGFTLRNSAEGEPLRFPKVLVIASPWNLIQDNIIRGSGCQFSRGIEIASSAHNNTISRNTIGYSAHGIRLQSRDNCIYHNNFIKNNMYHVSGVGQNPNLWDNGPLSGGNYWQGHMCIGNPSDGSQPFVINADNIDYYPFQDPNGWM